jgi:iron complex transport system substrate-binding protein
LSRALVLVALLLSAAAHAGVRVQDSAGRTVTLDEPARRIVALAPHIVENLFSAGAGDKIVGTVDYANFPPAAENIPTLGSAHAWSLESLVALAPDLVVLWESGSGMGALPQLERLGLTVYVSEPRQLSDIIDNIRDFGLLAGTSAAAEASAMAFASAITELEAAYGQRTPLSVFYQIWNRPLQTINGKHLISAVMRVCGGRNLFEDLHQLAPRVSLESVLERDPDVIVTSGMGESRPEWLDSWRQYPQLTAVKNNALLHVHPDLIQRPTVRIAQGAALLCAGLENLRAPVGQ